MHPIELNYELTLSDFRKATYYGLVSLHRTAIVIMLAVLSSIAVYLAAAKAAAQRPNPAVWFLATAYLVWVILLCAGAERGIHSYLKDPNSMIGVPYRTTLDEDSIRLRVPSRGIDQFHRYKKLFCVIELSSLILVYLNSQEVWLIPKRSLTDGQLAAAREVFRSGLDTRFRSRFMKKKK